MKQFFDARRQCNADLFSVVAALVMAAAWNPAGCSSNLRKQRKTQHEQQQVLGQSGAVLTPLINALWSRITKNPDVQYSTGPLPCLFAHLLAPLTHCELRIAIHFISGPWVSFFLFFFPSSFFLFFCLFRVYGFWVSVLPFLFFPFCSPIYRFISLVSYGGLGFSVLPFS